MEKGAQQSKLIQIYLIKGSRYCPFTFTFVYEGQTRLKMGCLFMLFFFILETKKLREPGPFSRLLKPTSVTPRWAQPQIVLIKLSQFFASKPVNSTLYTLICPLLYVSFSQNKLWDSDYLIIAVKGIVSPDKMDLKVESLDISWWE